VETCSSASSTRRNFLFLKNTEILIFGGILKFHLWAVFGQFWADFAALTVADSMPQLGLKS
jgi:hypothetical protein